MFLPPHLLLQAVEIAKKKPIELPKNLILVTGGSSISAEQIEEARSALPGVLVAQCYGQTEIAGTIARPSVEILEDLMQVKAKPGACGPGIDGVWYKVCFSKCFPRFSLNLNLLGG